MTWKRAKIYKKDLLTPRPCKKCGQWMNLELLTERYKQKSINQRAAIALAKKHGERIGRPIEFDDAKIIKLRSQGMTYREISKEIGCSTSVISRALRNQPSREA